MINRMKDDWQLGVLMSIVWFGTWAFAIYFTLLMDVGTGLLLLLIVGVVTYLFLRWTVRSSG